MLAQDVPVLVSTLDLQGDGASAAKLASNMAAADEGESRLFLLFGHNEPCGERSSTSSGSPQATPEGAELGDTS